MNVTGVGPDILLMYRVFDVSGVLLMGIIGGTIARQRGFDIVGFSFIALFSALGGGMIRDVLINQGTVAAIATPEYLILAFVGALIARLVYFKGKAWERFQFHGDAIVSALWAATGCVKALSYDLPVLACVMMGVFTAVGGSMIRDVVTGGIPSVFGSNQPTVIPAVAATVVVLVANAAGYLAIGMVVGPIVSFVLAMYGYWAGWRVNADADWAPVNRAVGKVEQRGRRIGRRVEPRRIRSWRHQKMEKALQRRIERGLDPMPAMEPTPEDTEEEKEIGFDFDGDSYEGSQTEKSSETINELLNMVLADERLTDALLERLAQKQRAEAAATDAENMDADQP